mmetsp:Transcript_1926/g.7741  ORF Transcript_1926/g.7741 Transcript_1926/m.7741 type:complete len:200 (+) Transcript_1926:884-1483(+)
MAMRLAPRRATAMAPPAALAARRRARRQASQTAAAIQWQVSPTRRGQSAAASPRARRARPSRACPARLSSARARVASTASSASAPSRCCWPRVAWRGRWLAKATVARCASMRWRQGWATRGETRALRPLYGTSPDSSRRSTARRTSCGERTGSSRANQFYKRILMVRACASRSYCYHTVQACTHVRARTLLTSRERKRM